MIQKFYKRFNAVAGNETERKFRPNKRNSFEGDLSFKNSSEEPNGFNVLKGVNRKAESLTDIGEKKVNKIETNTVGRFGKRLARQGIYAFFGSYIIFLASRFLYNSIAPHPVFVYFANLSMYISEMVPEIVLLGVVLYFSSLLYKKIRSKRS